ncbi:MAG: ABC transporter ATP-binding protein [Propionibacteriaceae bacterium]|jgi:peptide/nickel transport system ATP-binding protein|nr:ABC transporter ATP-binding protein [Propionibacteriaceae bacterium]
MTALVSIDNLSVSFTGRHRVDAVKGLSLSVRPGQAVALVGESGSGKSVTARSIVGLTGPDSVVTADRFEVAGRDALSLSERQWRQLRGGAIGFVLQDALTALDPLRTVQQEISEVLRAHKVVPRRQIDQRVQDLLRDVGVDDPEFRAKQYAHQLSGGLRQRALIASGLAGQPDLLVVDEPTTALDVTIQAQILALLRAHRERGTAMLVISHDLAVVSQLADYVIVMNDGLAVEEGPTEEVLTHPAHPYTRDLLSAIPSQASRGRRLSQGRVDLVAAAELAAPVRTDQVDDPRFYSVAADGVTVQPVLQASGVTKFFPLPGGRGRRRAVADVDLSLFPGQKLGIVGESGSGKSTLARVLLGLIAPDQGEVRVAGESWATSDRAAWRRLRRQVQFISQDSIGSFDPRYTVAEIIAEPILGQLDPDQVQDRVRRLLGVVGLPERVLSVSPRLLSGGQAQRVAICRALALRPTVIICDEPVSALDVSIQAQVLDLLNELNSATGTALAFISHDLGVVRHLVDQVIVMNNGFVVEQGDVEAVFDQPRHPYTQSLIQAIPQLPTHRQGEIT